MKIRNKYFRNISYDKSHRAYRVVIQIDNKRYRSRYVRTFKDAVIAKQELFEQLGVEY